MFTGLVETVGEVLERKVTAGGVRLRIATSLETELAAGDSLAVNGVCLTVIAAEDAGVHADVGPETLRVTTLGGLARGSLVNLERPLRADSRFGGHFVQGHVDAVGFIEDLRAEADFTWLTVGFPPQLAPYIVPEGVDCDRWHQPDGGWPRRRSVRRAADSATRSSTPICTRRRFATA